MGQVCMCDGMTFNLACFRKKNCLTSAMLGRVQRGLLQIKRTRRNARAVRCMKTLQACLWLAIMSRPWACDSVQTYFCLSKDKALACIKWVCMWNTVNREMRVLPETPGNVLLTQPPVSFNQAFASNTTLKLVMVWFCKINQKGTLFHIILIHDAHAFRIFVDWDEGLQVIALRELITNEICETPHTSTKGAGPRVQVRFSQHICASFH